MEAIPVSVTSLRVSVIPPGYGTVSDSLFLFLILNQRQLVFQGFLTINVLTPKAMEQIGNLTIPNTLTPIVSRGVREMTNK